MEICNNKNGTLLMEHESDINALNKTMRNALGAIR